MGESPISKIRVPNTRFNLKFKSGNDEFIEMSNYGVLRSGKGKCMELLVNIEK